MAATSPTGGRRVGPMSAVRRFESLNRIAGGSAPSPIDESAAARSPVRRKSDGDVDTGSVRRAAILSSSRPKRDLRESLCRRVCCHRFDSLRATLVDDNILVGNREAAASRDLLMYYGVTHIINATLQVPNMFPDDFLYCNLRFEDNEETNISAYFKRAIDFMKDAHRENRRVLVHCVAGASRSVTLVVAYLMCVKKQRLDDSLAQVQKLRFVAQPNNRFLLALATLEVRLFGWSSVATSADKQWNFLEWNRIKSTVAVAPARPRAVCVIM